MKLHGVIEIHAAGERILRSPSVWDKIKRAFGGDPDLRTDRMKANLEATAIVDGVRGALKTLGVSNAISLVIDDQVLFQDREGKPDDLGDLFLAFHENASVFGGDFKMLRLAAEHEEAGLHLVFEVVARTEHKLEEPAGQLVIAARIRDFEPRPGEDAETYRKRVEPLTQNLQLVPIHKAQFESFLTRTLSGLRAALPEARFELRAAEAQVQRPTTRPPRPGREPRPPAPTDPRYDPFDHYYPSPMYGVLNGLMWASIFSMAMRPDVVVVNDHGDHLGHASDLGDGTLADNGDGDVDQGDFDNNDFDADGDVGDAGDDGGGFDGGDFGGDFGGGDW